MTPLSRPAPFRGCSHTVDPDLLSVETCRGVDIAYVWRCPGCGRPWREWASAGRGRQHRGGDSGDGVGIDGGAIGAGVSAGDDREHAGQDAVYTFHPPNLRPATLPVPHEHTTECA